MTSEKRQEMVLWLGLTATALAFLAMALGVLWFEKKLLADPENKQQVASGEAVYRQHCAACHGAGLEGQDNWRRRLPSGRMPAPPHDASGHTWHHPDEVLFGITKEGLIPGKYAPPGYESDMPAFAGKISDEEIWAVLTYIKSSWPPDIQRAQDDLTLKKTKH